MQQKPCAVCKNNLPSKKRTDAKYCSQKCYKIAKKERDKKVYFQRSKHANALKNNKSILHNLYLLSESGKNYVLIEHLEKLGFDFDVYETQREVNNRQVFIIDNFCYSIISNHSNSTLYVQIWKQ